MFNYIYEEEESFYLKEIKEEYSIYSNDNKNKYDESENYFKISSFTPFFPLNVLNISSENLRRENKIFNKKERNSIFYFETLENSNKNIFSTEKNINFQISSKKNFIGLNKENEELAFLFKLKRIKNKEKSISQIKHSSISDSTEFSLNKRKKKKIFKIKKEKIKYNILSKEEKKKILKDLKKNNSIRNISLKYNVSIRNLTRWKKKGIERKKGSGRKFKDPKLEEKMLKYYLENKHITTKEFREKAKFFSSDSSFKASIGWLMRIKKKYNLVFEKY